MYGSGNWNWPREDESRKSAVGTSKLYDRVKNVKICKECKADASAIIMIKKRTWSGHVNSQNYRRVCVRRCINVNESWSVCQYGVVWRIIFSTNSTGNCVMVSLLVVLILMFHFKHDLNDSSALYLFLIFLDGLFFTMRWPYSEIVTAKWRKVGTWGDTESQTSRQTSRSGEKTKKHIQNEKSQISLES